MMRTCSALPTRFVLALLWCVPFGMSAQNVGISLDGAVPHASALLDVDVSGSPANGKRGMLIPRMTTAERVAMPAPATSTLVYDTTANGFWYFNGMAWVPWALVDNGWRTTGNAGLTQGTHFIGTTDDANVRLRVNNVQAGHLADGITSFGANAGATTGTDHTAFGYQAAAGLDALNEVRNTAVGYRAALSVTGTANNTVIGSEALLAASVLSFVNTVIGHRALASTEYATACVAVGHRASELAINISSSAVVGAQAGANGTVDGSVAVGYQAGMAGLDYGHAVFGSRAAGARAFGANASLALNTNVVANAFGYSALASTTTGDRNVAVGYTALVANTTGSYNTAIGARAMISSTGSFNSATGYLALGNLISGTNNTALGALAGPTNTALSFTSAIGYNSVPTANGRMVFGTTLSTNLTGGYGAWQNPSDARFKRDVRTDVPGIEFIRLLRPVTYNLDAPAIEHFTGAEARLASLEDPVPLQEHRQGWHAVANARCTGLLAQEVAAALDSLGAELDIVHRPANEQDHYTLSYAALVVPLVRTVQQQQERIAALRTSNRALIEQLEALERHEVETHWSAQRREQ